MEISTLRHVRPARGRWLYKLTILLYNAFLYSLAHSNRVGLGVGAESEFIN